MDARVERVPLSALPADYPREEIRIALHRRAAGAAPRDYLTMSSNPAGGRDLVAVLSLGTIGSADRLDVEEARLDGRRLVLRLRRVQFGGAVAANVLDLALAMVELGDLAPGRYEADIAVERYVYTRYEQPESAVFDRGQTERLAFEVAPS